MSSNLDHDYCLVLESNTTAENGKTDQDGKDTMPAPAAEASDLSTNCDILSLSSLSPAHSTDSGVDAGIEDFLADLASSWKEEEFGFEADDFNLEAILNMNMSDNHGPNEYELFGENTKPISAVHSFTKETAVKSKGKECTQEAEPTEKALLDRNRKNAIAARENRQKKKQYVEGLESEVKKLRGENRLLKSRNETMASMVLKLRDEVRYLKSVLANQSTISVLLKSVAATPGISLSSSLLQSSENREVEEGGQKEGARQCVTRSTRKRRPLQETESSPAKRTRSNTAGGVCFHVSKGKVSLELCSKCEKQASQSG